MSSTGIGVGASMIFGGVKASPSFEYSGSAFCADATDPTPTINGTPGGTFTSAPVAPNTGTLVINSSTGTVDLSASDVGNYLVTYTVAGKSESDPFEVLAVQSTAFSYTTSSFQQTGTASPTITGTSGGVFSATSGIIFSDTSSNTGSSTGVINLAASTIGGPYTITYTNTGACQGTPSTFNVSVTAAYASTSSFSFDGVNDYFEINSPILNSAGDMTVSAWVKFNDTYSYQGIFESANYYTTGFNGGFSLRADGVGLSAAFSNGTSFVSNIEPAGFTIEKWFHVAFTFNNTSKLGTYYIDGSSIGTHTFNSAYDNADLVNGAELGRVVKNSAYTLNGYLDEVSIWDSALISAAVTEIAAGPNDLTSLTNASSSNLKAWYKM